MQAAGRGGAGDFKKPTGSRVWVAAAEDRCRTRVHLVSLRPGKRRWRYWTKKGDIAIRVIQLPVTTTRLRKYFAQGIIARNAAKVTRDRVSSALGSDIMALGLSATFKGTPGLLASWRGSSRVKQRSLAQGSFLHWRLQGGITGLCLVWRLAPPGGSDVRSTLTYKVRWPELGSSLFRNSPVTARNLPGT